MLGDNKGYFVISIQIEIKNCPRNFVNDYTWNKFAATNKQKTDINVTIKNSESVDYQVERYRMPQQYDQIMRCDSDVLVANEDWSLCTLLSLKDPMNLPVFLNHIYYSKAVFCHLIQCHSSLIEYRGEGILFLGPSGIGKTTQAELWNKYRNARIINGDIVFVQETSDAFLGWGTPWHGSSPYCENTSVPVKALIVLKQAPENSIRELTGFEKVTAVSNNVFYPRWLEGGMELCLETLNHLLSALPVYELSCRPDEEAVRLTEEAVFGGSV